MWGKILLEKWGSGLLAIHGKAATLVLPLTLTTVSTFQPKTYFNDPLILNTLEKRGVEIEEDLHYAQHAPEQSPRYVRFFSRPQKSGEQTLFDPLDQDRPKIIRLAEASALHQSGNAGQVVSGRAFSRGAAKGVTAPKSRGPSNINSNTPRVTNLNTGSNTSKAPPPPSNPPPPPVVPDSPSPEAEPPVAKPVAEVAPTAEAESPGTPTDTIIARKTSWTFIDDDKADFDKGTHTNTSHNGSGLTLVAGQVGGTFTSQIFTTGGAEAAAKTIQWIPSAPYGKPLPDNTLTADETEFYGKYGADLRDLVLLYHMDGEELSAIGNRSKLNDHTGNNHSGEFVNSDALGSQQARGVFGQSASLERNDFVVIPNSRTNAAFDYGTGSFTWAAWVKLGACPGIAAKDTRVIMGGQKGSDGGGTIFPEVWIGARCDGGCGNKLMVGLTDSNGVGDGVCSTVDGADGKWHHVAFVKSGHVPARTYFYVDGVKFQTGVDVNYTGNFDLASNPPGTVMTADEVDQLTAGPAPHFLPVDLVVDGEIRIGSCLSSRDNQFLTQINVDEVAIWKRKLSTAEIQGLYYRGTKHASLKIRSCHTSDCAGVDFVGPDGTNNSRYSEATNTSASLPTRQNFPVDSRGEYFQYQYTFETSAGLSGPEMATTTIAVGE